VSVIFAINLVLTQRVLRAIHPKVFWHPLTSSLFTFLVASVPFFIIFNITVLTASFFVTTPHGAKTTKDLLFLGSSWNMFLCLFPIIFISLFGTIPSPFPIEKFGTGRFRTKIVLLMYSSSTLFIGAIVRLIAAAQTHPINEPGQVDTKSVFYLTGFMLEIFVVVLFAVARFDLRFHIPNGCTGPGQYAPKKEDDQEEFFQDVDVKMRFSYSSSDLPQGSPTAPEKWQEVSPDRTNATREQARQAIYDLKLNSELVGAPMDAGDSELLIYTFRVKKMNSGGGVEMPRPPPSSIWMGRERERSGEEMI
jgi:hypothetical protein